MEDYDTKVYVEGDENNMSHCNKKMLSFFLTSMIGDRLHCIRLINALSTLSNLR